MLTWGCKTYLYFKGKAQHFWKVRTLEGVSFPNQLLWSKWNFCCRYLSFRGRMLYHVKHRQRRKIILLKKCSSRQSGLAWQLYEKSLLQNLKVFGEMASAGCSLKTIFLSDLQETLSKRRAWERYMTKPNFNKDKTGLLKNRKRKKLTTSKQSKDKLFFKR